MRSSDMQSEDGSADFLPDDQQAQVDAEREAETKLLRELETIYADAEDYIDVVIGEDRAKAMDYYLGRPMGDERDGWSKWISREVYKVVEGITTAVANIYVEKDDACSFVGRGEGDDEKAKQRTAAVNYVFHTQNPGFLNLLSCIKSGILSKAGFLTWKWDKRQRVTHEKYRGLNEAALGMLMQNSEVQRLVESAQRMEVAQVPGPDGQPVEVQMPVYDVTVAVLRERGQIVIECVPPEEVLVPSDAKSPDLQRCHTVFWRTRKTREELIQCGYSEDLIEQLSFDIDKHSLSGRGEHNQIERRADESTQAAPKAEIITAWREVDFDGDGYVELRRIVYQGDFVMENEVVAEINMSGWTPLLAPHEFMGRSPADDAIESQELMTVLMRQTLNNVYLANNPMWRVDESDTRVRVEDFAAASIGKVLRGPIGSSEVVQMPFVGQHNLSLLEYASSDQENTTGFTRYSQGLDGQSLNQTATGIRTIATMSQQRVKLIARMFSELALIPCLKGVSKLLSENSEKPLSVKLRGQYVQIDPREWQDEYDMVCTVGLGMIDKDQQAMHYNMIAQSQAQAVQAGGLGKIVTMDNIYNVQAAIAENAGIKDPGFAWTDPKTAPPPPPPPPPPEVLKAQEETKQAQMAAQVQMEIAKMKAELDMKIEKYKTDLKASNDLQIAQMNAYAQAQRPVFTHDRQPGY